MISQKVLSERGSMGANDSLQNYFTVTEPNNNMLNQLPCGTPLVNDRWCWKLKERSYPVGRSLALVVQSVDKAIQQINHYPVDKW